MFTASSTALRPDSDTRCSFVKGRRTSERLVKLIALYCLIGWRIFWLTMQFRAKPEQPAETVFSKLEIKLLDKLKGAPHPSSPSCLGHYLLKLAQLGGYLARASDPPPGNKIFWRGLTRLHDLHLGYLMAKGDVGIESYGRRLQQ